MLWTLVVDSSFVYSKMESTEIFFFFFKLKQIKSGASWAGLVDLCYWKWIQSSFWILNMITMMISIMVSKLVMQTYLFLTGCPQTFDLCVLSISRVADHGIMVKKLVVSSGLTGCSTLVTLNKLIKWTCGICFFLLFC